MWSVAPRSTSAHTSGGKSLNVAVRAGRRERPCMIRIVHAVPMPFDQQPLHKQRKTDEKNSRDATHLGR